MRREWTRCLLLVVALIQPLAWAGEAPAPTKTPSELGRLEQVLSQAQQEKDQGQLKPERYQEFLLQFRGSLDIAWSANARSAEDSATYARIIARLGDPAQALAVLGPALEQAPDDPDLRLASGEVRFEQKDYPAALAEANAVLAKDPGNRRALELKHFSKGRISGAPASSPASPRSGPEEGGSIWNDPRIVEAGRRATGRRNAIHFMDQAMSRLKISDPREALRFLALAEVSDPTSADVPMQQGLAYMDLKAPGKALGRFSQAEVMWQAKGHANAALARALKERAADELAVKPREAAPQRTPVQDPRRTTWPLAGAAAGFALAGAVTLLLKKDEIERARRAMDTGALIVAGGLVGGLLGYAAYGLAAGAGGETFVLAGGGTLATATAVEGGAAAFTAAGGLAGGAAAAKAAEGAPEGQSKRETPASGDPGQGPVPGPIPIPLPIPIGSQPRPEDCALKPRQDVLDRFIDGKRLALGFLAKHEGPGHTKEKHVRKKIEYLQNRLREEGIEDASSFFDETTAEQVIRQAVLGDLSQITAWHATPLNKSEHRSFYRGSHLQPIGNSVSAQNPDLLVPKYDARVRLMRTEGCQIYILTAYPE